MNSKSKRDLIVAVSLLLAPLCLWVYIVASSKVYWSPTGGQGVSIEERGKICRMVFAKRNVFDFKPKRFIEKTYTGVFTSAHWTADESVIIYGKGLESKLLLREFKKAYPDYRGVNLKFIDESSNK